MNAVKVKIKKCILNLINYYNVYISDKKFYIIFKEKSYY